MQAIKPDMIFLWDEAWCAYARFSPILRRRTAMWSAEELRARFEDPEYQKKYTKWRAEFDAADPANDDTWLETRLMPDPQQARVRVYATHSTHKTLTALRQGSMIHVHDQDFEHHTRNAFNEAYMTHTSTSPNYQILASLDVGRRQVELQGHDMVGRSIELAMMLRERITSDPLISKFFSVLAAMDMIHIGMTRGTIAHLVNVLSGIAIDLNDKVDHWSSVELAAHEQRVFSLNEELPPLPNFSRFHPAFLASPDSTTPEGDLRRAFYFAYDDTVCEHIKIEDGSLLKAVESGDTEVVSAAFVTPYPPGFPVLVPGQVVTREIVQYLMALDVKEIHGYEPMYGTRVFKTSVVAIEDAKQNGRLTLRAS